ncbi:geranylgeranylglyceryl/heptaprenylglyceryl phosphate synthase [Flavobacterium sediminilitoris]|uniref:Geranylgeranylglyceryl phosphate synthase n=1 Tax=Flavobacterium sediminilitoris TaxID=2024526 RepID=A0ABY4HPJ3_9FLAO|nr:MULTISPECIES: geranylgeranylglyceryl/heptaprenylglyceryl phosphate synthase [Flavobacterium]UOX34551.1 geranylgeranylglyceryl/heptaprenylglyceryl phosphate synthase [Flavobacterium sediminilitoris]
MTSIYQEIVFAKKNKRKLLVILLDPEKILVSDVALLCSKIKNAPVTHIFLGGSTFNGNYLDELIVEIKKYCTLPILLFPGDHKQISNEADGILFLSLLSGRNPDYLIEHQINAVPFLKKTDLEIIPTAYLLIESGTITAVERVSLTKPLDRNNIDYVCQTAKAGEFMGNKLVYLEAGSGAKNAIPLEMIKKVVDEIQIPLIVGGGISTQEAIEKVFEAGADMVVIGTAFENDNTFFN